MRRWLLLWIFAFLFLPLQELELYAGATDWQTLSSQDGSNRRFFYTSSNALVTTGAEFRAYVIGADSSDADNQFDGVLDATSGGWDFNVARDTWVSIYRIDGTDVAYESEAFLHGGLAGKGAVDDTTIVAGSVGTAALADSSVTGVKMAAGEIGSVHLADLSITGGKLAAASITAAKMGTGEKFFTDAGTDSIEVAYLASQVIENITGGASQFRGSWEFDDGTGIFDSDGPQWTFNDSVAFLAGVRLGTNGADLLTVESNAYLKGDALFGSGRTDSVSFRGPVHFDDVRLLDPSSIVCDSLAVSTADGFFEVTGISDLQSDGYQVHCRASPDWTYYNMYVTPGVGGNTYKNMFYCAPVRQVPLGAYPASDSVYVAAAASILGIRIRFCLECFGVK